MPRQELAYGLARTLVWGVLSFGRLSRHAWLGTKPSHRAPVSPSSHLAWTHPHRAPLRTHTWWSRGGPGFLFEVSRL